MDFINWSWDENLHVTVTLSVKQYIKHQPVDVANLDDIIQDLRIKARSMVIVVDLVGANIFHLDIRNLTRLLVDVYHVTKDDQLLRAIQFKGAHFLFRKLFYPFSLVIPRHVRDLIQFI
jgi:hypothetical protein